MSAGHTAAAQWRVKPAGELARLDGVRGDVEYLCSDEFRGRKAGDRSMSLLAGYIAGRFESLGIEGLNGKRFQNFELSDGGIGRNVLGVIPGVSGRWVIVAANYDGLGETGGVIYPGADANASGIAALLEIAGSLNGVSPRDGILFVALDARYDGYRGAQKLLELIGRRNVKEFVYLDVLGNSAAPVDVRRPRYMMALGGQRWRRALKSSAELGRIEVYYEYYRSDKFTQMFYSKVGDQSVFVRAGVPVTVMTSGVTMDTNKPSDVPSRLDYMALRDRALCIARTVRYISDN